MNITPLILSIPPYLSTTWKSISALYVQQIQGAPHLVVTLMTGDKILIPHLDLAEIEAIFAGHAAYSGAREKSKRLTLPLSLPGIEGLSQTMEHDPRLAETPALPPDFLEKIGEVAKMLGLDELGAVLNPEPHCNCPYCQVTRALRGSLPTPPPAAEEAVSDEELHFRDWVVEQTGEKVYSVINPLDQNEHYSVFLGEPLGCTCGTKQCEHIRAVLST